MIAIPIAAAKTEGGVKIGDGLRRLLPVLATEFEATLKPTSSNIFLYESGSRLFGITKTPEKRTSNSAVVVGVAGGMTNAAENVA